jgi:predicted CoA-substrate-specific enzyme activase
MTRHLFCGIDAGSSATKCVLIDDGGSLVGSGVMASGLSYEEAAACVLDESLREAGATAGDIGACIATGYGRDWVPGATRKLTEITCHARGAREWYPRVRNIIDIGGQDTKVIRLDVTGQISDYRMNAKCAAGTGTFLESIAIKLGMTLPELDALAATSESHTVINSYCTVFAGTEVLECIKAGEDPADIARGLFRSIASRLFEMIASHDGPVAATGGVVAHCESMQVALNEVLDDEVLLPPLPQFAGAYGAALMAREGHDDPVPTGGREAPPCGSTSEGGCRC